jgi:hypothetical protein
MLATTVRTRFFDAGRRRFFGRRFFRGVSGVRPSAGR